MADRHRTASIFPLPSPNAILQDPLPSLKKESNNVGATLDAYIPPNNQSKTVKMINVRLTHAPHIPYQLTISLFVSVPLCASRPLRDMPFLLVFLGLFLGQLLLVVYAGGGERSRVEQAGAGHVHGAVGHHAAALGGVREPLAQRVLPVLLAQVVAPPDAAADPDAGDGYHHDHEEDHPLVVRREPGIAMVREEGKRGGRGREGKGRERPTMSRCQCWWCDWPQLLNLMCRLTTMRQLS